MGPPANQSAPRASTQVLLVKPPCTGVLGAWWAGLEHSCSMDPESETRTMEHIVHWHCTMCSSWQRVDKRACRLLQGHGMAIMPPRCGRQQRQTHLPSQVVEQAGLEVGNVERHLAQAKRKGSWGVWGGAGHGNHVRQARTTAQQHRCKLCCACNYTKAGPAHQHVAQQGDKQQRVRQAVGEEAKKVEQAVAAQLPKGRGVDSVGWDWNGRLGA